MIEFFVCICHDVFFEVIRYAARRQLTKLERIGQRLHRVAEKHFVEKPFLQLELTIRNRSLIAFQNCV